MPWFRLLLVLGFLVLPATPAAAADSVAAVRARLETIAGLRIESGRLMNGRPFFVLWYSQPTDHHAQSGERFEQRITLWHRGFDRPMVLATSGYGGAVGAYAAEPTSLVSGNQLDIEQRFFEKSTPASKDWTKLDIWQAATDHHRIVQAFKTLYGGKWLSTGASKGGMTSVYHRRFYPADVDATIAYVAPQDTVNEDDVYVDFVQQAGTDPACNEALRMMQRNALYHRQAMVAKVAALGDKYDLGYGSADRVLEAAVLETPFQFWQYRTQANCAQVPGRTATPQQLFTFIDGIVGWSTYADDGIAPYLAYYYQSVAQLNWPDGVTGTTWLKGLLHYPEASSAKATVPDAIEPKHDPRAMLDVDNWMKTAAERILFVYGENDPWSAEPFIGGPGTKDCHWYVVPGGNHGANLAGLPAAERAAATAVVKGWVSAQ
ncbi:S28 family serine protease [Kribbella albertanoniae]|uniref:Peptidase S37 n=1 Tax=Kribbella albertanoniae TaxID=1266829 RepID=A0A4R4P845_9ACTN|nr:S28 family serine protease [Kribbella albertanoniae]TDC16352.1 peptidase S37 [Kribbella albertanoniae]